MTRISRFKLNDRVYNKLFVLLFEVLGKRKNKEEFNKILLDLFSPTERIMIAKRVVIIYLLMKNIDYRIICNVVKVSNGTVSKFKLLMEKSQGIVDGLRRTLEEEKLIMFFEELYNDLFPPGVYGVNWSNAWKRKIELQRKKQEGI